MLINDTLSPPVKLDENALFNTSAPFTSLVLAIDRAKAFTYRLPSESYKLSSTASSVHKSSIFDDFLFRSIRYSRPRVPLGSLLHVTMQIRLYLQPFWLDGASTRLSVLPFGIVVAPSSLEAWLRIVSCEMFPEFTILCPAYSYAAHPRILSSANANATVSCV